MEFLCAKITPKSMPSIINGILGVNNIAHFANLCLKTPVTKEDQYLVFGPDWMIVTRTELLEKYTCPSHPDFPKRMIWTKVKEKDAVAGSGPDRSSRGAGGG